MRGILGAPQLFVERPVGVMPDQDVALARQPPSGDHRRVAVPIPGEAEVEGENRAAGIVEGAVPRQGRPPRLEPRGGAAIEQHHASGPRLGQAATPMAGWAPRVLGGPPLPTRVRPIRAPPTV